MFKFYNFPDSFDITKKFLEKRLLRAELQALGNFFSWCSGFAENVNLALSKEDIFFK